MKHTIKTPRQVEEYFDHISGELICSSCRKVITTYGRESGRGRPFYYGMEHPHICAVDLTPVEESSFEEEARKYNEIMANQTYLDEL